jgi:hypothetical protein
MAETFQNPSGDIKPACDFFACMLHNVLQTMVKVLSMFS